MRINGIKGTLKCRPIIIATTATGGKRLPITISNLPEVQEIYNLSGRN